MTHIQTATVRDTFIPAYTLDFRGERLYAAVMPRNCAIGPIFSPEYVQAISDPRHQPDTLIKILDVKPFKDNVSSFLFGPDNELMSVMGRADPCVDHETQMRWAP